MSGESLGSFGGETAFSGEYDLRNRTAGTVFAGPPNFNTLFREFSDHRDAGSPEIQPVYKDGRTVRFANDASRRRSRPTGQPWDGTRVLYLMHPSDPIVWWSPHLVFTEPDWIGEPPGKDVLEGDVLDAVRDLLAGHRRPAVLHRGPGRSRPQVHGASTSTGGTP